MISQSRDLRTGSPVWEEYRRPRIPHAALERNVSSDVLIIGAGISGAMMAEALSLHGLDVVLVDKRKPLAGSTSASTALLQYEIDVPLTKLIPMIGYEKAARAWRRSKLGVESLAVKIQQLKIKCDYERRNSLYLSGNILNPAQLEEEGRIRAVVGLPSQLLSRRALKEDYGLRADAALKNFDNIACNPVQLAAGFLNAAVERGARIFTPVEIEDMAQGKGNVLCTATNGCRIKARNVIFATGYEIPRYIQSRKHKIASTWALSTKPVRGLPEDFPLFWEAADPYSYARSTSDGRIIFGGEDEKFCDAEKRDALIPEKQKALERKLKALLPDLAFETEHVWTGSFGGSSTGLPSIGRIPNHKNCYAVMAYGGNGITFSRIATEIISAQILGHRDPDEKLFAFSK